MAVYYRAKPRKEEFIPDRLIVIKVNGHKLSNYTSQLFDKLYFVSNCFQDFLLGKHDVSV